MTDKEILQHRLHQQYISHPAAKTAADAVSRLCAIQAQDFAGAKWSIGLRAPGLTDEAVEAAIAGKTIVRMSSLRGTIHFLAAEDARWVTGTIRSRLVDSSASFYKGLGLTEALFAKSREVFRNTLEGGQQLSRDELKAALDRKKIDTSGQRMNHFISRAGVDQVICFAPRRGKEFTYALLDEWLPEGSGKSRQGDLSTLAQRYFAGHGPATVQDFAWWCGSALTAARAAIQQAGNALEKFTHGGQEYWTTPLSGQPAPLSGLFLLPGFDEYYLGYTQRGLLANTDILKQLIPANGILQPIIVINGRIEGVWKRTVVKNALRLEAAPFSDFSATRKKAMVQRSKRFAEFMGMPAEWV